MIGDVLPNAPNTETIVNLNKSKRTIQQSQEIIYRFLIDSVKNWSPETVLLEFQRLFIYYEADTVNSDALLAMSDLIFANNEEEFISTLKRSCYILINNWDAGRHYTYISDLVQIFASLRINKKTLSPTLSRLRLWLSSFVESEYYQQLKLFASKYEEQDKPHWSQRYTSYLLVPQYVDLNNPVEQREAARALSQQLKDRFKFELAMYTARSQSGLTKEKMPKNPTGLGDEVLRLIKTIVAKRGPFSYLNLANIFVKQTEKMLYQDFKLSLQKYLLFSFENKNFVHILKTQLAEKLETLYEDYHEESLDDALLLRTSNKVIEYLTTENQRQPSQLFILLMSQGNPLTLVIVLLKIVLICKNSRTHLEKCIAFLIQYYLQFPEEECQWIISFFDIFSITFAIYADNVQYNLIRIKEKTSDATANGEIETYRVFSQQKIKTNLEVTTEEQQLP